MSKILVGRDNTREVEVGFTAPSVTAAKPETVNAETKEELAEKPVEDEQVAVAQESDAAVPEAKTAPSKGRGKKRSKA